MRGTPATDARLQDTPSSGGSSHHRMVGHRELEPRSNEASDAAGGGGVGCGTCPFKSDDFNPQFLKARLKENYDTNHMGCRQIWPKWKPGLCHKGGGCAGYVTRAAGEAGGGRDDASERNGAQVPIDKLNDAGGKT